LVFGRDTGTERSVGAMLFSTSLQPLQPERVIMAKTGDAQDDLQAMRAGMDRRGFLTRASQAAVALVAAGTLVACGEMDDDDDDDDDD
jgi:hypothetical protein